MWRCLCAAVLAAGCGTPCNGNVVLTINFPDFAIAADEVRVAVGVYDASQPEQVSGNVSAPHTPGSASGTMNLHLAQYRPGDLLDLEFQALAQGSVLADVQRSMTLSGSCGELTIDLSTNQTDVRVEQNVKNKVDILFMIDDSPSMLPKQNQLRNRFSELIKVLDDAGAKGNPVWYHLGVVTSDLGAGPAVNGGCAVGGLGARLQPLGKAHAVQCSAPLGGLNFIDYNQLNGTNNLPATVSLVEELGCMASVGDTGCGFEQPLESVYRALHDAIPANVGFLRPDSVLAVFFLTDEDDCSAPPDTDLFDVSGPYGAETSYRCTNYGILCNYGSPPIDQLMPYGASGGTLMGCRPAPNPNGNSVGPPPAGQGKLIEMSRYTDFFTRPGGVRTDPRDVILGAIAGPPQPVSSDLETATGTPCAAISSTCNVRLVHSCNVSATAFGDPAVRISNLVQAASGVETPVCDLDYTAALTQFGSQIVSRIGVSCLPSALTDPSNPNCTVEDRANIDNSLVDQIPSCAANGNLPPCWLYAEIGQCPMIVNPANGSTTQGTISINRGATEIPVGSHARVTCATETVPNAGSPLPL